MCRTVSERAIPALCALALVAGCGRAREATPDEHRPNVILISIDSLRADHLGCYGYDRPTSPTIDALARSGTLFEHAVTQAPWTLPAHASLLTSLYSRTHQTNDVARRLPDGIATLAGALREAGYATRAIVSGPFMHSRFGLDRGFEAYDDALARMSHRQSHEAITSGTVHERALELIDTAKEPFFLLLHYWDVHYDYVPPPPFDSRFDPGYAGTVSTHGFMKNDAIHPGMAPRDLAHVVALYDGEIAWVDEHIGKLLDAVAERGLDERTIVVLTADHGDEFFEHGEKGHMHALYEELLHVPLIVRGPGFAAGGRIAERVELIDVMPTLLEATGTAAPDGLQGRSLGPLLRGAPWPERPGFSETTKARKSKDGEGKTESWCVYDGRHKWIQFAEERYPPELYDLATDPAEAQNLAGTSPSDDLRRRLERWFERVPAGEGVANSGVDEDTLRHLRSLGYVGNE